MAKMISASESAQFTANTVFIDTNLDTHFVMAVSDDDTVRDLKNKIMIEHPSCFPRIGEITVHALKVKRKGCFYHLSDSMLIRSAFDGVTKIWFLHVDASSGQARPIENLLYSEPGTSNIQNLEVKKISDESRHSSDIFKRSDSEILKKYDMVSKGNEVTISLSEDKRDISNNRTKSIQYGKKSEALQHGPVAKKNSKHEKENGNTFYESVEEPLKENVVGSKEICKLNNLLLEKYSEDKKKSRDGALEVLCNKPPEDEGLFPTTLDNEKRKKRKKSSGLCDQVDSANLSWKNVSQETFKELAGNNHIGLNEESDAASSQHDTLTNPGEILKKEKHHSPVQEAERTTIPRSSLSGSHGVRAAKGALHDVVADSFVGIEMCERGVSKVESKRDASENAVTSGGKAKGRKKHRLANTKGLTPPMVDEPENIRKDITPSVHENVGPDDDKIDHTDKTVKENVSVESGDPETMSSKPPSSKCVSLGQNETEMNTVDVAVLSKSLDASGVLEVGDSVNKRRKKSNKAKNYSAIEHDDSVARKEDSILPLIEKTKGSDIENPITPFLSLDREKHCSPVQEAEESTIPSSLGESHGMITTKATLDDLPADSGKVGSKRDDSEQAVTSRGRKMKAPKKHRLASAKGHTPPVVEEPENTIKDIATSVHENVSPDRGKIDHTDNTIIENVSLQNCEPETMLSEAPSSKCVSLDQNTTGMNTGGVVVLSKSLEASGVLEAGDLVHKIRKKSKKTKDSDSKNHISYTAIEHANSIENVIPLRSESHRGFRRDHPSHEAKEDIVLHLTKKTKGSKIANPSTLFLGLDKEAENASGYEQDSSQPGQIAKIQVTEDNGDKVKKKSKKTHTSTAKNQPDWSMKEQDVDTGVPGPSTHEKREENAPSKKKKKRSRGTSSMNQLTGPTSEAEKYSGDCVESVQPHLISGIVKSSQIPSDMLEYNEEGCRPVAEVKDDYLVNGFTDEANNHKEVPKYESDRINFIDYFLPGQGQHEVVAPAEMLVDKEILIKGSDKVLEANKKTKKRNFHSGGTSPDLQSSLNANDNWGHKRKPKVGVSDIQHQEPLSKGEQSESVSHPNGKTSIIGGDRAKAQTCIENDKFDVISNEPSETKIFYASRTCSPVHALAVQGPSKAIANISLKETIADLPASSSSSESLVDTVHRNKGSLELQLPSNHYRMAFRKASNKIMGEVLDSSKHKRSLLATSDTIFKESHSESSDDEGEVNNSNASTRSPSDSSSSSDCSEGSYGEKRKENGVNNTLSQSAGPKNVSLDMIFRSSRSYKKAKLTASQSQHDDTESQPADFVLDSLADP